LCQTASKPVSQPVSQPHNKKVKAERFLLLLSCGKQEVAIPGERAMMMKYDNACNDETAVVQSRTFYDCNTQSVSSITQILCFSPPQQLTDNICM
jgi:hypothetical protein